MDLAILKSEGWVSCYMLNADYTYEYVLAPEHDAAQVHWGGNWRMPTDQELQGLIDNCDWTWVTVNGVNGYEVRGKAGYASASIFLPAAGVGVTTSLIFLNSGRYWSSDTDNTLSPLLAIDGTGRHTTSGYRYSGYLVRPIQSE